MGMKIIAISILVQTIFTNCARVHESKRVQTSTAEPTRASVNSKKIIEEHKQLPEMQEEPLAATLTELHASTDDQGSHIPSVGPWKTLNDVGRVSELALISEVAKCMLNVANASQSRTSVDTQRETVLQIWRQDIMWHILKTEERDGIFSWAREEFENTTIGRMLGFRTYEQDKLLRQADIDRRICWDLNRVRPASDYFDHYRIHDRACEMLEAYATATDKQQLAKVLQQEGCQFLSDAAHDMESFHKDLQDNLHPLRLAADELLDVLTLDESMQVHLVKGKWRLHTISGSLEGAEEDSTDTPVEDRASLRPIFPVTDTLTAFPKLRLALCGICRKRRSAEACDSACPKPTLYNAAHASDVAPNSLHCDSGFGCCATRDLGIDYYGTREKCRETASSAYNVNPNLHPSSPSCDMALNDWKWGIRQPARVFNSVASTISHGAVDICPVGKWPSILTTLYRNGIKSDMHGGGMTSISDAYKEIDTKAKPPAWKRKAKKKWIRQLSDKQLFAFMQNHSRMQELSELVDRLQDCPVGYQCGNSYELRWPEFALATSFVSHALLDVVYVQAFGKAGLAIVPGPTDVSILLTILIHGKDHKCTCKPVSCEYSATEGGCRAKARSHNFEVKLFSDIAAEPVLTAPVMPGSKCVLVGMSSKSYSSSVGKATELKPTCGYRPCTKDDTTESSIIRNLTTIDLPIHQDLPARMKPRSEKTKSDLLFDKWVSSERDIMKFRGQSHWKPTGQFNCPR